MERLRGLDETEKAACLIAEQALGAVATAYDVPPRQGAVDAFLDYPDGRRAALEVTNLATDGGASLQLAKILDRVRTSWRLPGDWWWTVQVDDRRDLPRLGEIFERIVLLCERAGVTAPNLLPRTMADADVRWLVEESSVVLRGHPDVPAVCGQRTRRVMVTRSATWGFVDGSLSGLDEALADAFAQPHLIRRVAKLARTAADERHLFVVVGLYDWPFHLFDPLATGDTLPAGPPVLPAGVSHLWLAPIFGHRSLLGTSTGWSAVMRSRQGVA